MSVNEKLQEKISIEDGQLCYELDSEILNPFLEVAESQWNATKTLPESWRFDEFTIVEYKKVWIVIAAICYIHFFSCLKIKRAISKNKKCFNNSALREHCKICFIVKWSS